MIVQEVIEPKLFSRNNVSTFQDAQNACRAAGLCARVVGDLKTSPNSPPPPPVLSSRGLAKITVGPRSPKISLLPKVSLLVVDFL